MFGARSFGLSISADVAGDGLDPAGFGSAAFGVDDFGGVDGLAVTPVVRTIRPNCGGMYGTGTFGQRQYAAHIQCSPSLRTTRPDCGGIYGTGTLGQRYYAGHKQCRPPIRFTRPDCGGIYGSGAWGMRYYAGHKQCGYVPPIPPTPTPSTGGPGGLTIRHRKIPKRFLETREEEDLELILSLWMSVKK